MTWVAIAIGGSALIGAGASYAGAKKQSDASKAAANLNQQQFGIINAQQQPFIQSGYGALSRLNTLLGLNPRPQSAAAPSADVPRYPWTRDPIPGGEYRLTPGGGIQPIMQTGDHPVYAGGPGGDPYMGSSLPLNRILALRAMHGDTQAGSMLQRIA